MTHLQVEQQKLQVKSGVLWVLLYSECKFNLALNVATTTFFRDFKSKTLRSVIMHSILTMKLQLMSHVIGWPITGYRLRKKTFRNRTRSISES